MLLYHVATEREFFLHYDKGGKQAIILNHCDICDFSDWIILWLW